MTSTVRVAPGADGTVSIGITSAPAGVGFVPFNGVTLVVDPTDGAGVPTATVTEPQTAAPLVASLFGDDVADALATTDAVDVPVADLPARALAVQAGYLDWLRTHRPLPLDAALVDLELAVLRGEITDDSDLELLADPRRLASLTEMARRVRENPGLPLAGELSDLFARAAVLVPRTETDPALASVNHERALLDAERQFGSSALTPSDLAWLAEQRPVAAVHLGTHLHEGTSGLDWLRVPSAMLPAPENGVVFTIDFESGRVDVTVEAARQAIPHPALPRVKDPQAGAIASLRSFDWPLPLATAPLTADPATGGWRATLTLTAEAAAMARSANELDLDVRSETVPWAAPNRRRVREATARRWAARGITSGRLAAAAASAPLAEQARAAFAYAVRLWAPSDPALASRCRSLARTTTTPADLTLAERWLLAAGPLVA